MSDMTGFSVSTDTYQGPLETLLALIDRRKVSVSHVSLADVTDAYIAYVERLPELPLGETAQFILIASTLLLIKSRTLLPTLELSEDERESVEELERRLVRYQTVRKAAALLRSRWDVSPFVLTRNTPRMPPAFFPGEARVETILEAVRSLVSSLPKPEKLAQATVAPVIALEDVILSLKKRINTVFRASFRELTRSSNKPEVIVHFLALLELIRSGSASVTQERLFEDILIEPDGAGIPRYG